MNKCRVKDCLVKDQSVFYHLLDCFFELTCPCSILRPNVCSLSSHVLTIPCTTNSLIYQRTPVTAVHNDRSAPFFSDRVKYIIYKESKIIPL